VSTQTDWHRHLPEGRTVRSAIAAHRWQFAEIFCAILSIQLLSFAIPIFFQIIVDRVIFRQDADLLRQLSIALAATLFLEALVRVILVTRYSELSCKINAHLNAVTLSKVLSLPIRYVRSQNTGALHAKFREMDRIIEFAANPANVQTVSTIPFILLYLLVMYYYNPLLTAVSLALFPLVFYVVHRFTKVLYRVYTSRHAAEIQLSNFLIETLQGIEAIKSMRAESWRFRLWRDIQKIQLKAFYGSNFAIAAIFSSMQIIGKVALALPLAIGAHLVLDHQMSVGALAAFSLLLARAIDPLMLLAGFPSSLQQLSVSSLKVNALLNDPDTFEAQSDATDTAPINTGTIAFEQVSFGYRPSAPPLLRDLTFTIQHGEMIGLVGPTGSGKTTITKLIQRHYEPELGHITLNGTPLGALGPDAVRTAVGVVPQDCVLFSASIADNITLGDPAISLDKVIEMATLLGSDDFIRRTAFGYDTLLSPEGSGLSGGQKQQINILRALVRDPLILILDEPTSAMDYHTENRIIHCLTHICKNKTVILIAHRLVTVQHADRIFVIEGGRIVDHGRHQDLIHRDGYYSRAYKLHVGT